MFFSLRKRDHVHTHTKIYLHESYVIQEENIICFQPGQNSSFLFKNPRPKRSFCVKNVEVYDHTSVGTAMNNAFTPFGCNEGQLIKANML